MREGARLCAKTSAREKRMENTRYIVSVKTARALEWRNRPARTFSPFGGILGKGLHGRVTQAKRAVFFVPVREKYRVTTKCQHDDATGVKCKTSSSSSCFGNLDRRSYRNGTLIILVYRVFPKAIRNTKIRADIFTPQGYLSRSLRIAESRPLFGHSESSRCLFTASLRNEVIVHPFSLAVNGNVSTAHSLVRYRDSSPPSPSFPSTRKCTRDLESGCLKKIKEEARSRSSLTTAPT